MTTPSPDKQETLEAIANRICRHYLDSERVSVAQFCDMEAAIVQALRNERERCAKVADRHYHEGPASVIGLNRPATLGYRLGAQKVAAAIREGR